jgi:hypothetical protein
MLAAVFLLAPMFAVAQIQPKSDATIAALRAAYSELEHGRTLAGGEVVVIRQIKQFIVVSFLAQGNVRGGRTHVVYDPALDKIVYVLGEQ